MIEWLYENRRSLIFYTVFFLFLLTVGSTANGYDYDLWARLIAGMSVVQTGHVLKQDFLAYTPTHIWFDHEWGSGVIFYIIQHFFSAAGLLFAQTILLFLIFFMITKIVKLLGVKTTNPYNLLFYVFAFCSINYVVEEIIRCQLFSFLFFTFYIYILELARKGNNKPLFALPFLMIIWNNLHGGCTAGIGLIILYAVGEFFNKKPFKKYLLALLATCLMLPINPWGFSYLGFLLSATTMHRMDITEWFGIFSQYHKYGYIEFKMLGATLLLAEIGFIIKGIKTKTFNFDATKFLIIGATLFLAIQHVKLIPLAVISMCCFLYDDFYTFFNELTRGAFNKIANFKDVIIYCIALIYISMNLNGKIFETYWTWNRFPTQMIEFIKVNELKGDVFVDFWAGSYAGYKLYPNNKIFMDGRYEEVYYDYMMPMLHNFLVADTKGDELLKRFPPKIIIIEKFYPAYRKLLNSPEWKQVYEDEHFGLFVQSADAKKQYKLPSNCLYDYKKRSLTQI